MLQIQDFEIKSLGEYHDLCMHIDSIVSSAVFRNFRNKYIKKYMELT